ncbi:MAG: glycosyltransferase family 4 protein [Verrucomicrobiota bacterium]
MQHPLAAWQAEKYELSFRDMRITLIHYSAPPIIGGVERIVAEQIEILRKNGHHVSLACFSGGQSINCECLIPLSHEAPTEQLEVYLAASLSGMDVVLMHNVCTMPFSLPLTRALRNLSAKLPATRWIAWVHDLAAGNPDYSTLSDSENQAVLGTRCTTWEYVAISKSRALEVVERLKTDCKVIPNGIDLRSTLNLCPKIVTLAEACGWWDSDLILLQPARLIPRKAVEVGLHLVCELKKKLNIQYLVTGASDPHNNTWSNYANSLRSTINELELNLHVTILQDRHAIGAHQLSSVYAIADALFFPSHSEGFGLPMLEAAAFRLPAFCADHEPLNSLPGARPFPPKLSIPELCEWVIQQTSRLETIKARNSLTKTYRWQAIYRNFLAPLLEHPQT